MNYAVKAYWRVDVSRPRHFVWEIALGTHWTGGWLDPTAAMKKISLAPAGNDPLPSNLSLFHSYETMFLLQEQDIFIVIEAHFLCVPMVGP
jgi:hypothetical protein